jgi:hypothetical protein
MSVLNSISVNTNVRSTKTHRNLTLQNAIIAIAVYAAQIDRNNPNYGIKRIEDLAKKSSLFKEESKQILTRIYKFVNSMSVGDPLETVEVAAKSLTPKYRETAYKWATELVSSERKLSEEQNEILDWLRVKLSIDSNVASKTIFKK